MGSTGTKRRSRPLRQERADALLFVTSRTVEERFWLHPLVSAGAKPANRKARRALRGLDRVCSRRFERMAKHANARRKPHSPEWTADDIRRLCRSAVGDALRRAQDNNDVEIFAVVVMSNHIHLVIRTPQCNCADFLRDFKSIASKNINRLHGREGPLWARRADVQPILDDSAGAGRVAYTIRNPEKARLVTDPEQWPGLSLCFGLGDADEIPFEFFDFAAWHSARRPKDKDRFFKSEPLKLSPLPAMQGMDREAYAADVRAWIAKQILEDEQEHGDACGPRRAKDVLGVEAVIKAAFHQRPKHPKRSPRPHCFGSPENRRAHYEQTNLTVAAYDEASEKYRAGDPTAKFPVGTYPPPLIRAAA